jgi:acetyltransferase-like isoleucine patch superfamily enzyme
VRFGCAPSRMKKVGSLRDTTRRFRAWTDRRQSRYFAQSLIRSHPRLVRFVARARKIMAMVINRSHAFGEGLTLPAPERLGHLPRNHTTFVKAEEVWARFRETATISDEALLGLDAWTVNLTEDRSRLTIGPHSVVRGIIRVERDGHVRIANHCYIGDDVILSAHVGIDIEPDVLIAHGVQVFDNVTHPIDAGERARHYRAILAGETYEPLVPAAPITIECNAWIGMNSILMKGVRVGARSIIAAGSVVVDDVPQDATVAGNPARPTRRT